MKKNIPTLLAGLTLVLFVLVNNAEIKAASSDVSILLTEHCVNTETACPEPQLQNDSYYLLGSEYQQNETIVLDIKIKNPTQQTISSAQTWLSYDTNQLEGVSIETYSDFDLSAPGEKEFDRENGRAKIGVASTKGGSNKTEILVATVTFKVLGSGNTRSKIEFYDHRLSELGHTSINILENGFPVNVLTDPPKALEINLNGGKLVGGPVPISVNQPAAPLLSLQRPTGLRVGTGDSYAHLIWNLSNDSNLAGYNLYYSMQSGRYLHRKELGPIDEFYISGLLNDETYYFAITAIDKNGLETDYSDEVAISINHPETSTAPIAGEIDPFALGVASQTNTGPKTNIIIIMALFAGLFGYIITNKKQLFSKF